MSEHKIPIPSRVYNAAVGGHVTGADQIIDDKTGLTLDKVAGGALEEKEYTSSSNNGMGRVVLRKNIVKGVNTLTQSMINKSNTIYIIQYDFILGEDITILENCILEFDGGSVSGTHTITGADTCITAINDNIFDESILLAGTFTGYAYADWVKISTNDVAIQISKLSEAFKEIHFKNKEYYIHTSFSVNYNLVGDSRGTTLIVYTPIAMEYQSDHGKIDNIKFVAYNGGTLFSRCNDKSFYNCEFEGFDYLFNQNVYIGRTYLYGCRIENVKALNHDGKLINGLSLNDCFIDQCSGWFTTGSCYTNLRFNNCNIQQTYLISQDVASTNAIICFNDVVFNACYIETYTIDFGTIESSGLIYFHGCHFAMHRIINTGQNSGQYAALANLLITFESCDIEIPNLNTDLIQFNINNYIKIRLITSLVGKNENGTIRPVNNIESVINNPTKLWYEITTAISGNWSSSIKYGDKNIDGTPVEKVVIISDHNTDTFTQDELNQIFKSDVDNVIYKIRRHISLLNLQEINLGNNCVLQFEGGYISSGTTGDNYIKGSNLSIITNGKPLSECINSRVTLQATLINVGTSRPTNLNARDFGFLYFDTTLGKPIWYNGNSTTGWVDATGTPV